MFRMIGNNLTGFQIVKIHYDNSYILPLFIWFFKIVHEYKKCSCLYTQLHVISYHPIQSHLKRKLRIQCKGTKVHMRMTFMYDLVPSGYLNTLQQLWVVNLHRK